MTVQTRAQIKAAENQPFPWAKLPQELQLQVLHHCLTKETALFRETSKANNTLVKADLTLGYWHDYVTYHKIWEREDGDDCQFARKFVEIFRANPGLLLISLAWTYTDVRLFDDWCREVDILYALAVLW